MIIYNVTVKIEHSIQTAWVKWMKEKHIPDVMATGCFEKYQFAKLIDIDETDGYTYSVQYYALSKAIYNQYIEKYATTLRADGLAVWGNRFIGFRSVMQVVD